MNPTHGGIVILNSTSKPMLDLHRYRGFSHTTSAKLRPDCHTEQLEIIFLWGVETSSEMILNLPQLPSPSETRSVPDQGNDVSTLNSPVSQGFVQCDRDAGSDCVSETIKVHHHAVHTDF